VIDTDLSNCSASEPFALRVVGDDMAPEFEDGHIIVVDPGGQVRSGCYVIAQPDGQMIFRQLIQDEDRWLLRALAPAIDDVPLDNGLGDIVGVISQRAGRRRREHKRYDV
jgi:DNA polymerase V